MKFVFIPPQNKATRDWAARLMTDCRDMSVVLTETNEEAKTAIVDADAAFGTVAPEVLAQAQKLRWLQAPHAAPAAGYYYPALISHPVVVTNFREIYNDHISAHIMMYVLNFARGMHRYFHQQIRHEWIPPKEKTGSADETGVLALPEATMLIVGVGGVGAETARIASAFGMRVIGIDARRVSAPPGVALLGRPEELDDLLPQADFVVLTIPHTPATGGLFDAARFARMKKGAYFINIGRGKTTHLDALTAALRDGRLAGAGLDVFETEPLPKDHPLWSMPGVFITPHTSGIGPHLNERRYEVILENARHLIDGTPLRNIVDKKGWY